MKILSDFHKEIFRFYFIVKHIPYPLLLKNKKKHFNKNHSTHRNMGKNRYEMNEPQPCQPPQLEQQQYLENIVPL